MIKQIDCKGLVNLNEKEVKSYLEEGHKLVSINTLLSDYHGLNHCLISIFIIL